jgi:hypothetical protein
MILKSQIIKKVPSSDRGEFLKELKTLPPDVETIEIKLIQNLETLNPQNK